MCLLMYCLFLYFFFFKQKTAYEMRISDWSSDVCSSDLDQHHRVRDQAVEPGRIAGDQIHSHRQQQHGERRGRRPGAVGKKVPEHVKRPAGTRAKVRRPCTRALRPPASAEAKPLRLRAGRARPAPALPPGRPPPEREKFFWP